MLLQRTDGAGLYLPVEGITLVQAGAVQARTFSFIGSCTSTSSSLNFGSLSAGAIAAGDFAVYLDHAGSTTPVPTAVTPSGFTNHSNASNGNDTRGMISSKVLTGSEGSVTGMNGATDNDKIGLVFRPTVAINTVIASSVNGQVTSSDPTAQVVDPSAETTAAIVIGVAAHRSATAAFSTFSPAADATVLNSDSDIIAGYKIFNTGPALTTIDMNDLGVFNWLGSLYFTFT